MLGLVISGHGHFAKGLLHASQMIAGELDHVKSVLFEDGASLVEYQETLKSRIQAAHDQYGGVIVLTDLKGGTPFNTAMMASAHLSNVAVLSGTNLPMIIEGGLLSQFSDGAQELGQQLVTIGREGLDMPMLTNAVSNELDDEEDGI